MRRIHDRERHLRHLLRISAYSRYLGPWFNKEKGRVVIIGRGKASAYLKRRASRKFRRTSFSSASSSRSAYRKEFDFWWELI
jgi:hypothetical protein